MSYDLRVERWIPWRLASGAVRWGPPAALVERIDSPTEAVVGVAAPRPDFDGALQEFLIGLLSAALQPADERAWRALWYEPPTPEALQAALDALPAAFDLDGDGPRVFQAPAAELDGAGELWCIESALLDVPGSTPTEAKKRQVVTDLFVKPGGIERLSRPAAAMALLTLQTYATEGGRGHLTSMRGGGPLTTIAEPRRDRRVEPFWRKLWANVETLTQLADRTPHRQLASVTSAFPWLGATRAADLPTTAKTTPSDVHPLQAYFALPRRVRLVFDGSGTCSLTGLHDDVTTASFRMRTYGVRYEDWRHPLSPYYGKSGGGWLPEHGRANGIGWRDWLGLALATPRGDSQRPAAAVSAFHRRATDLGLEDFTIDAFGYKSEHKKVLCWNDAQLPAFVVSDEGRRELLIATAAALIDATGACGGDLLGAVKRALFQKSDEVPGDLGAVRAELWVAMEQSFYNLLGALVSGSLKTEAAVQLADVGRGAFAAALRNRALEVFDHWCPAEGLPPAVIRRRVVARHDLRDTLSGMSKSGERLYQALGIPLPGGGRAARAERSRATRKTKETTA